MTRLDVEVLASIIADLPKFNNTRDDIARVFATALKFTRGHFDEGDFLTKCGVSGPKSVAA